MATLVTSSRPGPRSSANAASTSAHTWSGIRPASANSASRASEGKAAGCWTVGVAASGNGVGLGLAAYRALDDADRQARVSAAGRSLLDAGAHLVVDTVAELPEALAEIERRIAAGEAP